MANLDGQTPDSLIAKLAEQPFAFDFCAAVRLLQSRFPNLPRIGHSDSPAKDPVRFAQNPALDFAPSTLVSDADPLVSRTNALRQENPGRPVTLFSRHFGLFGPNGPLPLCLTEYARDRIHHHGDVTFAAFCNVFHHRLISFFFRAWADAHKTVDFDRPGDQHWSHFLGSLIGIGMDSMLRRDSVPDRAKLYFAGRLSQQVRNAGGLEVIIEEFFGVHTELETFVGRWLSLPPDSVCKLGISRGTGTLNANVILGSRVWTRQLHFQLRMGPMNLVDFERLLPTGSSFRRLRDWIRQYAGEQFTWDVRLVLTKEAVPEVQLGKAGRLGWTTWLKTRPFDHDADDLLLQPPN